MNAVLIQGCHLQADEWEEIVWGRPKEGVLGRVPRGLLEALRLDAKLIIFGTGGSERAGLKEGEWALAIAKERIKTLPEFATIPDPVGWLSERAVLELDSMNTLEEVTFAGRIARKRGAERLTLVSSPTHILRAHKAALSAFSADENLRPLLHGLSAVASDVSYAGTKVDDVLIIEPAHRPDRAQANFSETLRDIPLFIQDPSKAEELNAELAAVMKKFKAL